MTTIALDAPVVEMTVGGVALTILDRQFSISLDEGNSPFLTARAVIARPLDYVLNYLDPTQRTPVKITVTVGQTTPLSVSLYVFERDYDPSTNTVSLTLVTGEYDMQTYSPSTNVNLVTSQSSVRALCQTVVQRATGAAFSVNLVGGATDKTFRVFSLAENQALNPKLGVNATGWSQSGSTGGATTTRNTNTSAAYPFQSYARLAMASGAAASGGIRYSQQGSFTAGEQYTFMMYGQVAKTGGNIMSARLIWLDSAGSEIGIRSYAASRATTSNWNQRFIVTATAPANAAAIAFDFYAGSGASAWAAGDVLYATAVMIIEGDGTDPTQAAGTYYTYFDGVTADTADYHYGWADVADASTSTRTPLVQRDPEALWWTPGVTAFDFLKPILDAVGLRLFYREDKTWCLADNGYKLPGQVAMQYGVNLYEGQEQVTLDGQDADGFPMNADAVMLRYSWTDPIFGTQKTAADTATTGSYKRPYVQDIDQPFPGPGQAAYLLARLQARKYSITTTARPDWTVRPGMAALVSLPRRPAQTGYVQSVDWDLASAQMTVTTKALVTAVSGSVGKAPATQTIGAVGAVTIGSYTN